MTADRSILSSVGSPARFRWLGPLISLASLVVLLLLLGPFDLGALAPSLLAVSPQLLLLAVGAALLVEVAKALRWQLILTGHLRSAHYLLALLLTARVVNSLLPLRAGDLWRIASVSRGTQACLVCSAASVGIEKAFDAVALGYLALLVLGSGLADRPLLFGSAALPALLILLVSAFSSVRPAILRRLGAELRHLRHLRRLPVISASVALTLLALGLGLSANAFVLLALGFQLDWSFPVAMLLAGYAAGLVPAAPAQLGVFELSVAAPLVALGLAPADSFAAALTLHVVVLCTVALGGLLSLPLQLLPSASTPFAPRRSAPPE